MKDLSVGYGTGNLACQARLAASLRKDAKTQRVQKPTVNASTAQRDSALSELVDVSTSNGFEPQKNSISRPNYHRLNETFTSFKPSKVIATAYKTHNKASFFSARRRHSELA